MTRTPSDSLQTAIRSAFRQDAELELDMSTASVTSDVVNAGRLRPHRGEREALRDAEFRGTD
jgi:hypothetical protein